MSQGKKKKPDRFWEVQMVLAIKKGEKEFWRKPRRLPAVKEKPFPATENKKNAM